MNKKTHINSSGERELTRGLMQDIRRQGKAVRIVPKLAQEVWPHLRWGRRWELLLEIARFARRNSLSVRFDDPPFCALSFRAVFATAET